MSIDKQVKEITSRDKDFAKWYTDVCKKADLILKILVQGIEKKQDIRYVTDILQ